MSDAAWPPNYPDSHDPTGPPSTEELLGESSAAQKPYCAGGTGTCDICVGSCGIEEHEASAASTPRLNYTNRARIALVLLPIFAPFDFAWRIVCAAGAGCEAFATTLRDGVADSLRIWNREVYRPARYGSVWDDVDENGRPEHIEADYKFAADAWLSGKMTIAAMDYGVRCQRIALEYAKRLELEKAGHPLGPYEETP